MRQQENEELRRTGGKKGKGTEKKRHQHARQTEKKQDGTY
jgi:hypothetical protein